LFIASLARGRGVVAAVVLAWVPAARQVALAARQRGEDEQHWFRLALVNPLLALLLLIATTPPSSDRSR